MSIEADEASSTIQKRFFTTSIPCEAEFTINQEEWVKLKSLQKGHRFLRGEWEDYFVMGMKESNKYCVFAFKDHYVNQCCVRARRKKKYFSANGYCVFEDCKVTFSLRMDEERKVVVKYQGEMKHCVTEVHARYFRGKSRQELKDVLKYSTPLREYLSRVQSADGEQIEAGNADFIGRSSAVYRRIASEAKDVYQSLLILRNQLIENNLQLNIKGFIQLIQHIPGCIVCFNEDQIKMLLYHLLNETPLQLYLNSTDTIVSTTIEGKSLHYYELCMESQCSAVNKAILPLSCMLTMVENESLGSLTWFSMLLNSLERVLNVLNIDRQFYFNFGHLTCPFSLIMIDKLLNTFCKISVEKYLDICYAKLTKENLSQSEERDYCEDFGFSVENWIVINKVRKDCEQSSEQQLDNFLMINICKYQVMRQIGEMCFKYLDNKENHSFAWYAFNVLLSSSNLNDLLNAAYAMFMIFLSKFKNKLLTNSFEYLKHRSENLTADLNELNLNAYNNYQPQEMLYYRTLHSQKNPSSLTANLNRKSKFYRLINEICEKVKSDLVLYEENECEIGVSASNPRYCPLIIDKFIQQFSAIIPICSKIMSDECDKNNSKLVFSLKEHDDRFRLLKSLLAHEKDSLDVFIKRLNDENNDLLKSYFVSNSDFVKFASNLSECGGSNLVLNESNYEIFEEFSGTENSFNSNGAFFQSQSSNNTNTNKSTDLIRINSAVKRRKEKINLEHNQNSSSIIIKKIKKNSKISNNFENEAFDNVDVEQRSFESESTNDSDEFEGENVEIETSGCNQVQLHNKEGTNSRSCFDDNDEIVIERNNEVIQNMFGIEIMKEDLDTIEKGQLLSSSILEYYLKMLELSANSLQANKLFIFPTDFYPSLKYGYSSINTDSQNKFDLSKVKNSSYNCNIGFYCINEDFNLFNYELVLIPVKRAESWSLCYIDFSKQKISYYDPIRSCDSDCLKCLMDFLSREHMRLNKTSFEYAGWGISYDDNAPKVSNSKDSGVFVLLYAKYIITENNSATFDSDDINSFRNELKEEIFHQLF